MKKTHILVTFCSLLLAAVPIGAQTFEINGQSPESSQGQKKPAKRGSAPPSSEIGWGSSIEVGRLARAAEDALAKGRPADAANFAERAVKAAPQNAKLWFLLGYTSRLAGRYPQSLDAYKRGLQVDAGSVEGLSGMAQTYARMGQTEEAKRLLMQVIAANPRRATDLLVAGELFFQTGDTERGLQLLQRADAMRPSAHSELLMATAYMRLKQPDKAKQLLDLAKRRAPRDVDIFRAVANY